MASVSTLKLYNTKINRKRNMVVESIEDYLATCTSMTIDNFQIIKHDKEIDIKVNISSPNTYENFGFNYVSIINNYDSNVLLSFKHYYFIDNIEYISSAAIKLHLILDGLNTFNTLGLLSLDSRTLTFREHKDRFSTSIGTTLIRKVDRVNEDVNPVLETDGVLNGIRRDSNFQASEKWDFNWYIIVQRNPDIKIAYITFVPEVDIAISIYDESDNQNHDYIVGGIKRFQLNQSETYKVIEVPYCPIDLHYDGIKYVQGGANGLPSGNYMYFIPSDITNNQFTFGIYYASSGDGTTYILTTIGYRKTYYETHNVFDILEKDILITTLYPDLTISKPIDLKNTLHNMVYESKLYNSSFSFLKFVYDTDSFIFKAEDEIFTNTPSIEVRYTPAPYDSVGLFKFNYYNASTIKRDMDYNVLVYKRKNELPLFNDAYLNYMRNGYNYDIKSRNMSLISGILGSSSSGAMSMAKGRDPLTSMAGTGLSIYQQAFNFISNDEQIKQNREKAIMQGINVSGSDDLTIFHTYSNNGKLGYIKYDLKEFDKNNLYNIFRLRGYATNEFKTPNTQNRRCYNYISCDARFVNENDSRLINYIEDLRELYREGITIFHKITNQNKMYDFEQELENWEISIQER